MDDAASLNHRPTGRWTFDQEVTECFEDMLARSIPDYETMRRTVFDLACRYAVAGTAIVDLGCSRGGGMVPLVERLAGQNHFVGVEASEPMYRACCDRFADSIERGAVEVHHADLREFYPSAPASVTLAVLTLQFVPIECRQRVVRRCFESTVPGGAMIVVEKVLGQTAEINAALVELYYQTKRDNGYTPEAIEAKRLSLEGVLVPVTARWNEELLAAAGFGQVDCVWRCMNFAGWVAVKGS